MLSIFSVVEYFISCAFVSFQILEALDTDPICQSQHLAHKLETVAYTISGGEASLC